MRRLSPHTEEEGRDLRLVLSWTVAALVIGIAVNLATMAGWLQ
ncbi:hypothetical protein [Bradyrhizobium sp. STM 3557]